MNPPLWFCVAHRNLAAPRDHSRDEVVPWSMPIVINVPKAPGQVPSRNALLRSAATAVAQVCLSEAAGTEDSLLCRRLNAWYGERIRKISRRARNSGWRRAQAVEGVTATIDGASARACMPSPVAETPDELRKLQIGGTDLPYDDPADLPSIGDAPTLWVDRGLDMSVGKVAAQVGHASMLYAAALSVDDAWRWASAGYPMNIREVPREQWPADSALIVRVQDAGFTEIAPGSVTVGVSPA